MAGTLYFRYLCRIRLKYKVYIKMNWSKKYMDNVTEVNPLGTERMGRV